MADALLPDLSNPVTRPFWDGLAQQELRLQRCDGCGYVRWPPSSVCPECLSREHTWVEVPAAGEIWSYVVYHRSFSAAFTEDVPYTVVMVTLDAGPGLVARLTGPVQRPVIGSRVHGVFRSVAPEVRVLEWALD
jgi:uncharacterized OB-fold protein